LSGNFAEMTTSTPFRDLLHAANLRHGTDGFTSPLKEGVLNMSTICSPFSSWFIMTNFSSILIVVEDISLGLHYVMQLMFLTHVGRKSHGCRRGN